MKNVVVKVTSKEHGAEVIQAFKDLGVDVEGCVGDAVGWYYGLFDGVFDTYDEPSNSQVITLEELKAMAKPYPKMMWVWGYNEETAQKREVIGEIQPNEGKYYITHSIGDRFPICWRNAKDIEEPVKMKTPIQEFFEFMEQSEYFTKNDLLAKYKELLEKEKEVMCGFAVKHFKNDRDMFVTDLFNETFNTEEK